MKMKRFVTLIIAGLMIFTSGVISASAATGKKTIDVIYNNIKVVVDGREAVLKDAAGKDVEPFMYDGTVYLPLRAAVNAITNGTKPVEWNAQTYTVYIGDKNSGKVDITQMKNMKGLFVGSDNSNGRVSFTWRGEKIVPFNYINSLTNAGEIVLEGKYSRLTAKLAAEPGASAKVNVYGDKNLLGTFEYEANSTPTDVDVSLIGISTLSLRFDPQYANSDRYFYNVTFEKLP